jgi:hypothetical protein
MPHRSFDSGSAAVFAHAGAFLEPSLRMTELGKERLSWREDHLAPRPEVAGYH